MARKSRVATRGRQNPSAKGATDPHVDSTTTSGAASAAKPPFDISAVEGFIPIEQFKNGWTLPEYDPDNPEHERAARELADLLARVQNRLAAERRAKVEAEAIAAEPKFVALRRRRKARGQR